MAGRPSRPRTPKSLRISLVTTIPHSRYPRSSLGGVDDHGLYFDAIGVIAGKRQAFDTLPLIATGAAGFVILSQIKVPWLALWKPSNYRFVPGTSGCEAATDLGSTIEVSRFRYVIRQP